MLKLEPGGIGHRWLKNAKCFGDSKEAALSNGEINEQSPSTTRTAASNTSVVDRPAQNIPNGDFGRLEINHPSGIFRANRRRGIRITRRSSSSAKGPSMKKRSTTSGTERIQSGGVATNNHPACRNQSIFLKNPGSRTIRSSSK